jgi:hypothetical protein
MGFRDQVQQQKAAAGNGAVASAASAAPKQAAASTPRGMTGRGQSKPQGGRYTGLRLADPRFPILEAGNGYTLKILHTKESRVTGKKPWLKVQVEVLETWDGGPAVGSKRSILKCCSEDAFEMSGPEIKNMMMAALGYGSDAEALFEEQNEDWPSMIDAVHGVPDAEKLHGENPLKDKIVRCDALPNGEFINCIYYPAE